MMKLKKHKCVISFLFINNNDNIISLKMYFINICSKIIPKKIRTGC